MKKLLAIVLIVYTLTYYHYSTLENGVQYVLDENDVLNSTCRVDLPDGGSGSCFHIGKGLFITSQHVIDGHVAVRIDGVDGSVIVGDAQNDIAVILCPALAHLKTFVIATNKPKLLADIYSSGVQLGYQETVCYGKISGLSDTGYIVQVPVNPGCSGGPLMNDRFEVIGINRAILSVAGGWNGVSYHVDIDIIRGYITQ